MSFTSRITNEKAEELYNELYADVSNALDKSRRQNEIRTLPNFHGDLHTFVELLREISGDDVEWVEGNDGVVEAWGCDEIHNDIMLWRVHAECVS